MFGKLLGLRLNSPGFRQALFLAQLPAFDIGCKLQITFCILCLEVKLGQDCSLRKLLFDQLNLQKLTCEWQ